MTPIFGKRCRKLKRGFATKKEAQEWEIHFKLQKASSLDMTFGDFYKIYDEAKALGERNVKRGVLTEEDLEYRLKGMKNAYLYVKEGA